MKPIEGRPIKDAENLTWMLTPINFKQPQLMAVAGGATILADKISLENDLTYVRLLLSTNDGQTVGTIAFRQNSLDFLDSLMTDFKHWKEKHQ